VTWTAILSAISGLVGLIRDFLAFKKTADDRQAGADSAAVAGRKEEDTDLDRTQAAIDEADQKPIEYRD
jgi:hypothetical protein